MIVPDLNLLIYAHNDEASQHVAARRWWEGLLSGQERVGLPWVVITGFVRLMTHPKSVARTISPDAAMDYVQHWLEFPHVAPLNPGSEHLVHFRNCLATVGVGGNLVSDSHIAAIAMENGRKSIPTTGTLPGFQDCCGAIPSDARVVERISGRITRFLATPMMAWRAA